MSVPATPASNFLILHLVTELLASQGMLVPSDRPYYPASLWPHDHIWANGT